ncbi:MAG: rhodanese-like domain-containing protein [Paracoccaceae bacterium]
MAPSDAGSGIGEIDPEAAYAALAGGEKAILIDVRTRAEWSFVGVPDLSAAGVEPALIEWQSFPTMAVNPDFAAAALSAVEAMGVDTVYFLCRSGVRSLRAALVTAEAASAAGRSLSCLNVVGGFEGDLDPEGKRGALNGWKSFGLPWRQS